jgi:hypothetical protein
LRSISVLCPIDDFCHVRRRLFTFGFRVSVPVKRIASAGREVWMMMAVSAHERFDRHAEEASCFPWIRSGLHKPSCCRAPPRMERQLGPRGVSGGQDTAKMTPRQEKNIPRTGHFDGHTA